jgi:putative transposase
MVECGVEDLPIWQQCALLGLSRSTYYYTPLEESPFNLELMRLMDEQYLKTPFYGVGQMTYFLRHEGHEVNQKRVRRLLRLMGLRAVCPGPHTSKPGKGAQHQVFAYLLGGMQIDHPGQVVGADITYIPLQHGFLYLVAFIDWYSRYVLSWELSNSLDVSFCLEALAAAHRIVVPQIVNTDQGAQFTSLSFVEAVLGAGSKLSMDGKGRAIDNVFTERLWRSLKYEEVYLKAYESGQQAWQGIGDYVRYYNYQRPCSSLGGARPAEVFRGLVRAPVLDRTAKI